MNVYQFCAYSVKKNLNMHESITKIICTSNDSSNVSVRFRHFDLELLCMVRLLNNSRKLLDVHPLECRSIDGT